MPKPHSALDAAVRLAEVAGMDIPEQLHARALAWAEADAKAYALEEKKTAELAKRCKALGGDHSIAAAEREVKASQPWHDHVDSIARARHEANKAHAELEYWRAKWKAWLVAQGHALEAAA